MVSENLQSSLEQLRAAPESMPWPGRLKLCQSLQTALTPGHSTQTTLELLHILAADSKWEVRQAVAKLLQHVPQDNLIHLGARLSRDPNDFVRLAAKKSVNRRRQIARNQEQGKRSADQIEEQLQWIESQFGKTAAKKARRLCTRSSELIVGSIVHDLRSILTHLKSNCHSLIEDASNGQGAKMRRSAKKVQGDLEYLEKAIQDMETFTQPTPPERHPERMVDAIESALEMARENIRKSGIDPDGIRTAVKVPQAIVTHVARHRFVMAIANVIQNAYESFASGAGLRSGRITITATVIGEAVEIAIQDNGMGLSEDEKRTVSLFTPGRRNKSKKQSTGYGLPIAVKNLAAHGGTLTLQSRENKGTKVIISIPLEADTE